MAVVRMPIDRFMDGVRAAQKRGDGYIMGATGQNPKNWAADSWWFTQYSGAQREKALYWRGHAARVWDCNGLAEGLYKDFSGVSIDTRARNNYAEWCGVKGKGMIPAAQRRPGAAVFWGSSAAAITHVAYLDAPVDAGNPAGDWYLIEARGVMYGVVRTRLNSRKPGYWGLMDRYFDYGAAAASTAECRLGERLLKRGMSGEDVRDLQSYLTKLGYSVGSCGADGEYGPATESAVKAFQSAQGLDADGEYGPLTHAALMWTVEGQEDGVPSEPEAAGGLTMKAGTWNVRTGPGVGYPIAGIARGGDVLAAANPDGWIPVLYNGEIRWISGKAVV